jgi:methionine sulfoxide reductase heme-binding subunit
VSHNYKAVGWNRQKKRYDSILLGGVAGYLVIFVATGLLLHPQATAETLLIRALGTCSFLLLHIILCIGPACRLDARFLPLLYNRRHMGVTMFVLALAHAVFATFQFHALGNINPLVSVLTSNTRYDSLSEFPFEIFGVIALIILFLMAATSHDFWLANLTAPVWKSLHMCVYIAYAMLVLHVVLGVLQAETSPVLASLLGLGMVLVLGLHLASAIKGRSLDRDIGTSESDGFIDVGSVDEIPERRAKIVCLSGERVAIFKYDGKISAISNVCQHQNGPLGEGCIINGLVTCPWHGYQYDPATGASPPPFTEKVPTFRIQVTGGRVRIHPGPLPAGTRVEPAVTV